jgi:hypothetical protein
VTLLQCSAGPGLLFTRAREYQIARACAMTGVVPKAVVGLTISCGVGWSHDLGRARATHRNDTSMAVDLPAVLNDRGAAGVRRARRRDDMCARDVGLLTVEEGSGSPARSAVPHGMERERCPTTPTPGSRTRRLTWPIGALGLTHAAADVSATSAFSPRMRRTPPDRPAPPAPPAAPRPRSGRRGPAGCRVRAPRVC